MTSSARSSQSIPRFKCWHPLLPAFAARLIFALRTLLGISCCAAVIFSPASSKTIQGQLLLGVGFIVVMKSTLGATIQAAGRLFLAGGIAAIYCLLVVNFIPNNVYFAVAATNIFVLFIVYTDLPVTVRRFSMLPTCIILLQWFKKPSIDTLYILRTWGSLSIGGGLAMAVLCIPLPLLPTAHRELTMRMKFIARQIRREITATVLLVSEYHNIYLSENYDYEIDRTRSNTQTNNGNDIPTDSYVGNDFLNSSVSFENLKDDHLLKSDLQDLHALVNQEIKLMERALTEIPFEPYFISLRVLNFLRNRFRSIPIVKKYIRKSSTLQTRLEVWATCFVSLQRTFTGMLSLDHHHQTFVGQQQLVKAICHLLDTTFNFLDVTLPYTTSSNSSIDIAHITLSRTKVEEALSHFFETYAQVRENPHHFNMSTTESIRLNTFLLLVLRFVHVIITAAETSETPGTQLDIDSEQTIDSPMITRVSQCKDLFYTLVNYIGLKPSSGKFIRAIKTSLSVFVSTVVVLTFRDRLQAYGWVYWAPMTTALVSDSSEGGTIRLSFQRLMAVLLGSTFAYIIILIAQNKLIVGILMSLFVAFMGYIKTDSQKEYFASVCAQSASIITFLSTNDGFEGSNRAVLARTTLTFLGIFIHVFISNLLLPVSARRLIKKKVLIMFDSVSTALKSASNDFRTFIELSTNANLTDQQTTSSDEISLSLMDTLAKAETVADSFPALLEEALNEPNFWKRPFVEVKDCYDDISKTLRRIIFNIRFVHRCTTILKAESKLHFAQEVKWQLRPASDITATNNTEIETPQAWTIIELRKQKQLQKDLDIPLTIFKTYTGRLSIQSENRSFIPDNSSTSLRIPHTAAYQPVLEHISTLEKRIQQVVSLTRQLIEKPETVDVGSFEVQQLCPEDNSIEEFKTNFPNKTSSDSITKFQSTTISTNRYKLFPCCHNDSQRDNQPLPSLPRAVDLMLGSLFQFLHANNHFIRTKLISIQSIGDILAFHTLSYALKDMVDATTDLAKSARRIKHVDTRTLICTEREEKIE